MAKRKPPKKESWFTFSKGKLRGPHRKGRKFFLFGFDGPSVGL